MIDEDVWDIDFASIHINKEHLSKWSKRYRMDVRFCLGRVKTEFDLELDKKKILERKLK